MGPVSGVPQQKVPWGRVTAQTCVCVANIQIVRTGTGPAPTKVLRHTSRLTDAALVLPIGEIAVMAVGGSVLRIDVGIIARSSMVPGRR